MSDSDSERFLIVQEGPQAQPNQLSNLDEGIKWAYYALANRAKNCIKNLAHKTEAER